MLSVSGCVERERSGKVGRTNLLSEGPKLSNEMSEKKELSKELHINYMLFNVHKFHMLNDSKLCTQMRTSEVLVLLLT